MSQTILVVDDFEFTTYTVGATLEVEGYQVMRTSSPKQALEICRNRHIDLIVTDFNMPQMNGAEFIDQVRKLPDYKTLPILVFSSETDPAKQKAALDAGITGWIEKPFKIQQFIKTVKRALRHV